MGRKILYLLITLVVAGAIAWFTGPRVPVDTSVTFDPASIGPDPAMYLATREATEPRLQQGLEKEIIWAFPASRAKTPLAIVYVHGFSASKGEVRPLPDLVAKALGANLFYTRLTGHGADGAAMAEASVNDWANDYAEAMAIGRTIGERVIVIATSTGAGLATWALTQPALSADVAGAVLISPNYGVQAAGSEILTMPFGRTLANWIVGPERGFEPINELHGRFWTAKYPTDALLPMAGLTALAAAQPVERITTPAFFIWSPTDKVIRPDLVEAMAARWGGPKQTLIVEENDDPYSHVIAGDALSPSTTQPLADAIIAWAKTL
ncbi:MAG: lysophospholipase [Rhizobiaceae bacterium]|nr:lysophospholipase [Rhizobiaceae bacterium]